MIRQHIFKPQYAFLEVSKHIAVCAEDLSPLFLASPILQLSTRFIRGHSKPKEIFLISILQPRLNKI